MRNVIRDGVGGQVIGAVEPVGTRWLATSNYGASAYCVSRARARTWVLMEHEKHATVPVAALKVSRIAEVNRALKARGAEERLVRGNGYYYFAGGAAAGWPSSSVYVYRADELTVAEWLREYDELKGAANG